MQAYLPFALRIYLERVRVINMMGTVSCLQLNKEDVNSALLDEFWFDTPYFWDKFCRKNNCRVPPKPSRISVKFDTAVTRIRQYYPNRVIEVVIFDKNYITNIPLPKNGAIMNCTSMIVSLRVVTRNSLRLSLSSSGSD